MPDGTEQMLNELIARVEKLEENQAAIDGAFRALITVFAVRRLPDPPGQAPAGEPSDEI
jgi:hypothetical protein